MTALDKPKKKNIIYILTQPAFVPDSAEFAFTGAVQNLNITT